MGKNSPSLRDVAQAAGVSLGTASRALNNKSNVLPSTRAQVLQAAADIGYRLQIRIPATVATKLNTIGVAVKRDLGELPRLDPFNYAVLCGIEDECANLGISLMYASLLVNEYSHAKAWPPLLENNDIDGLVIVGIVFNNAAIADQIPNSIPVVLVDAYAPDISGDMIGTSNAQGAYAAVSYLIDQGHSRIGLIGSNSGPEHPSIAERRRGYLEALSNHDIQETYIEDSFLHWESAYSATVKLLERAPEVTAIFACNDDIARHIIRAINDLGKRVPDDISVVGFDDKVVEPEIAPPLTTIRVEKELMGKMAVGLLYERAINPDRPPITTTIGTQLVIRDSVKQVRQSQPGCQDNATVDNDPGRSEIDGYIGCLGFV